ncbi:GCN5-related N-acetyltransferase [Pseudoxanthomonas suwonensis 11-1]|uniref:GCN5-related N-acetyltransferase n=1 Tax=Pseudoxanthomonas suwonensis (strain 11-1) TaxID=743721 RepID=E6WTT7_PSEUU|nr:GNAT family N-acetyltransferase [Pseudoxanthomonas suwonensis]ADV27586.1 GCN5-related N-acetyltransferase [Pseudoxanthomonas suwonensis 11-1]
MVGGPVIETGRLLLRLPQVVDFERYAELMADPEACRHIGGHQPRAAAWRRFLQMPGAWALQGFAMFSVIGKSSGLWLGQAGPWRPDGWPGNEIGWAFHPQAWGHGYATEAAQAAMDWAFTVLDWDEVIHCIAPDNHASQRVAQRLGSRNRGPVRMPEPYADVPCELWGQTRAQWQVRSRAS